jgi:hypothetical protein
MRARVAQGGVGAGVRRFADNADLRGVEAGAAREACGSDDEGPENMRGDSMDGIVLLEIREICVIRGSINNRTVMNAAGLGRPGQVCPV